MVLRFCISWVVLATLSGAALAADRGPLMPSSTAFPAVSAPVVVAQNSSCANACQTEHDRCRVATRGSPSCDVARQRCLQACISSKRK